MRAANNKFQRRFEAMEILASDKNPREFSQMSTDEMELLWAEVKRAEKAL